MSAADRAKRFRQRRQNGMAVWSIVVPEHDLQLALIEAGLVDPDSDDPSDYSRAAGIVLSDFAAENSVTRYGTSPPRRAKIR